MARKVIVHSEQLGYEPVELLSHNPKRIHATIYLDGYGNTGLILLGDSSQRAKDAGIVYPNGGYLVWEGINHVWACIPTSLTPPQSVTVLELVEE